MSSALSDQIRALSRKARAPSSSSSASSGAGPLSPTYSPSLSGAGHQGGEEGEVEDDNGGAPPVDLPQLGSLGAGRPSSTYSPSPSGAGHQGGEEGEVEDDNGGAPPVGLPPLAALGAGRPTPPPPVIFLPPTVGLGTAPTLGDGSLLVQGAVPRMDPPLAERNEGLRAALERAEARIAVYQRHAETFRRNEEVYDENEVYFQDQINDLKAERDGLQSQVNRIAVAVAGIARDAANDRAQVAILRVQLAAETGPQASGRREDGRVAQDAPKRQEGGLQGHVGLDPHPLSVSAGRHLELHRRAGPSLLDVGAGRLLALSGGGGGQDPRLLLALVAICDLAGELVSHLFLALAAGICCRRFGAGPQAVVIGGLDSRYGEEWSWIPAGGGYAWRLEQPTPHFYSRLDMGSEPRLTALLSGPTTLLLNASKQNSLQLPPLQDPSPLRTSSRPLPLEPTTSTSKDAQPSISNPSSHSKASTAKVKTTHLSEPTARHKKLKGFGLSSSPVTPRIRHTLERGEESITLQSNSTPRKRQRVDEGIALGEFVQLPKPQQKGKKPPSLPISAPTVVNGLNAPPPSAALFPPITPSSFHDAHGRNALNTITSSPETAEADPPSSSAVLERKTNGDKRPNARPRKKWSEEETKDLLQGVAMFGVGNWKKIVAHRGFRFNGRSSVDLKDRFRTCCPEQYRQHLKSGRSIQADNEKVDSFTKQISSKPNSQHEALSDSGSPETPRAPRSHRKKPEDLVLLGIDGPFPKAKRRERHPFTKTEDAALICGFKKYGSAWKLIQKDPSFSLHSRRATDLRDRFRNKYPKEYADAGYVARPPEFPKPALRTEAENPPAEAYELAKPVPGPKRMRKKKSHVIENPPDKSAERNHPNDGVQKVEFTQLPSVSSASDSSIDAMANDFTSSNLFSSTNSNNIHIPTTIDWGESILPPPTTDNDPDFQRMLGHIHPLATWKASFNPSNLIPPTAKPLNTIYNNINYKEKTQTNTTLFNPISGTSSILSTAPTHETQKAPLNLPPPTDLFSLDLDSTHPFHFSFRATDSTKSTTIDIDNGEQMTAGEAAGSLGLEAQGVLAWEDMATHPMFDIDGGAADREDNSGNKL
ncbi:MAG: hypothetical protein M1836_007861 [Candelina mexicana]|nr:MAG: hypothetical protein M1836_007861 [Candelina mexicana]